MRRFLVLVFGLLCLPVAVQAASFDCGKAATVVEKLICSDKTLSGLDDELASAYRTARTGLDAEKTRSLAQAQSQWLRDRNACETRVCLRFEYEQRIEQLREIRRLGAKAFSQPPADEDKEEGIDAGLVLRCNFADDATEPYEFADIRPGERGQGDAPAVHVFERKGKSEARRYFLKAGSAAECVFPSGSRVRLKVGSATVNPFGQCGADPMFFASLWVNGRKLVSRLWFAGRCIDESGESQLLGFQVAGGAKPKVTKCTSPAQGAEPTPAKAAGGGRQQGKAVCAQLPDPGTMPVDVIEYPAPGSRNLPPGAIEPLIAGPAVCEEVKKTLAGDFFFFYSEPGSKALVRPKWTPTAVKLPEELQESGEALLDFDNDGKIDRLLWHEFQSTYMQGSVLLVQPGRSDKGLQVGGDPLDKTSMFLPCQLDSRQPQIAQCPPFSQAHDEAGYIIDGLPGGRSVVFRGRYTQLAPFTFERTTYLALNGGTSGTGDTSDYVAVVKPLPGRKFQSTCLFRRVPENF